MAPAGGAFGPAEARVEADPVTLRGLAVTAHQYLVVAVPDPAHLLVFDLHAGGPPAVLPWPGPLPFRPFDLAPRADGGLWLLEADPLTPGTPARYWGLDRFLRLERQPEASAPSRPPTFREEDGTGADCPPRGVVTSAGAWPLSGRPVAIEALPDGSLLVLEVDAENGATHAARYRHGTLLGRADLRTPLRALFADPEGEAAEWVGHDFAFVPGAGRRGEVRGTLFVAGLDGNQAFAFALVADEDGLRAEPLEPFYPLRRFGGRGLLADRGAVFYDFDPAPGPEGDALLAGGLRQQETPPARSGGQPPEGGGQGVPSSGLACGAADSSPRGGAPGGGGGGTGPLAGGLRQEGSRWLPVLAQPKARYVTEGTVETAALDGREPGCVWHRLLVEACLPAGTALRVETRAADDEARLEAAPWHEEPHPYARGRGPELPFYRPFTSEELRRGTVGTWELLFQQARGRFLQLRITLTGTGRATPRLGPLRVYYPRFSYLRQYLPAVYREDEDSAHFLDRFLANVEGVFTDVEGRIAGVEALFDERLLDAEYLDWLAGWLGTVLDPAFDEARRRLFIRHAVSLYAERGTLPGLLRALRLALDPCPTDTLFAPGALDCDLGRATCLERHAARYGVRVVERFLRRRTPGAALGDPTASPALRPAAEAWTPDQGADRLHTLFRDFLDRHHGAALPSRWGAPLGDLRFPPLPPADPARAADWRAFAASSIAVPYAEVSAADVALYRGFLERRYRRVGRLNARYGTAYAGFEGVPLPTTFPSGQPRLGDWMDFASLVLPIDRNAARFDVLVPIEAGTEVAAQADRIAFVERLVARERPAHTEFEVKPFWALFRVGEARLGLDTVLDRGSRFLPYLLPAELGAVYVGSGHPWDVPDRFVTGRDLPGRIL